MAREAVHVAIAVWGAAIAEENRHLVQRLGREREEVPHHRRRLEVGLGIALLRVNKVTELERILDEEDWGVVADQIPVALFCVELDGEAARIAFAVGRTLFATHCRKTDEHRRRLAGFFEELSTGPFPHVGVGADKMAMGSRALGMDDALGNTL